MKREYHKWHSAALGRDMELLVHGHAGARLIAFPTANGRFFDWEDRGLHHAIGEQLEQGTLQLFSVDSIDGESWYAFDRHIGDRAWRHVQYDRYMLDEVLPFTASINPDPFVIVTGASFGGYHAVAFGLRHPHVVQRVLSMSGVGDIHMLIGEYSDENVYLTNPHDFIANEHEQERLEALQRQDIILAVGRDDELHDSNRRLSAVLWSKGIGNALREWDGNAHDWPHWEKMLPLYVGGHD